jgi:iron(III) transport system substrate-binding protein
MKRLLALALVCWASVAHAAEQSWDELAAAAKGEGKVIVIGPPDTVVRQKIPAAFKARFGITVEYSGSLSGEQVAKLRLERQAGLYSIDVVLTGSSSMATIFYPEKMLEPLKQQLVVPEVVDGSKWIKGAPWFQDPEQQYVLRLSNTILPSFFINTDIIKPDDLHLAKNLLDVKWQGKISTEDPASPGSGVNVAARFFLAFGADGVKTLYLDHKPVISRDARQLTDYLLRGTYPIALNVDKDQLDKMSKEGLPVKAIYALPDFPAGIGAGQSLLGMINHAPHPNAAKLFVNWIASKEGLEIYSRARSEAPTRTDIDAASYLPDEMIPKADGKYFDTYDWDFTLKTREMVRQHMKQLLGR